MNIAVRCMDSSFVLSRSQTWTSKRFHALIKWQRPSGSRFQNASNEAIAVHEMHEGTINYAKPYEYNIVNFMFTSSEANKT